MTDASSSLSKAEGIKADSHGLRGSLAEELADDSPSFSGDSGVLLKFHGVYAQDDRDVRSERKRARARRRAHLHGAGRHPRRRA